MRTLHFIGLSILLVLFLKNIVYAQKEEENLVYLYDKYVSLVSGIKQDVEIEDSDYILGEIKALTKYSHEIKLLFENHENSQKELSLKLNRTKDSISEISEQENQYFLVSGYVESREKNFAIIRDGERRYAIKTDKKLGEEFNANINPIEGVTNYVSPSGDYFTLGNYAVIADNTSDEKIKTLEESLDKTTSSIKDGVIALVNQTKEIAEREIERNAKIIDQIYYDIGEKDYKDGNFNSALNSFEKISNSFPNFSSVSEKLLICSSNSGYLKAKKLIDKNDFKGAYLILRDISTRTNFPNSLKLYRESFVNYYENLIEKAQRNNDIEEYSKILDSLYLNIKITQNDSLLVAIKVKWKQNLSKFIVGLFSLDEKTDNYFVIPEGYYYSKNNSGKSFHEVMLVSHIPLDKELINCSSVIMYDEPYKNNYISLKMKEDFAKWLNLDLLDERDVEFIDCDGWESVEQKRNYSSNYGDFNYKINLGNEYLKYKYNQMEDDKIIDAIDEKAEAKGSLLSSNITNEKDKAISSGRIVGKTVLFFVPHFNYGYMFNSWDHKVLTNNYNVEISEHIQLLSFGTKLSLNAFSDKSEYHQFHGFELNANYFKSIQYSIDTVNLNNDISKIGLDDFGNSDHNIKGFEIELFYRAPFLTDLYRFFCGVGYARITSEFLYNFDEEGVAINNKESFDSFSLTFGMSYSILDFYIKSYFSNNNIELFFWNNKNDNFLTGVNINIPISLIDVYPSYR